MPKASLALLTGSLLLTLGCANSSNEPAPVAEKVLAAPPNILLILADDLGWSDLGSYGGEIDTPHIDSLAAGGIRFTQFHNAAKCFPSRAALLTGQYAHSVGAGKTFRNPLVNDITLGDLLRRAGYRTLMVGKHHGVDNPYDLGFDHYWGLRSGAANYFNPGQQRAGEPKPAQKRARTWCFDSKCLRPFTPDDPDFYTTDAFTDWSLELLQRYRRDDRPFFLYLAYTAPHDPLHARAEDIGKYRETYRAGYAAIARARYQRLLDSGLIDGSYARSAPLYRDWASLDAQQQDDQSLRMAIFAAMVDRLDQNIGRLLAYLKSIGQFDNTLVLFASDNGSSAEIVDIGGGPVGAVDRWSSLGPDWANVGNLPFRKFKNYSHQGGINTPFIAHWPAGIKRPHRTSEFPGHFIDIMPTFADLTNASYPARLRGEAIPPMEGQSLLPLLAGEAMTRHKPLFWQWSRGKAVLDGHWKLVAWDDPDSAGDGEYELYDMRTDKTELYNVADRHPQIVGRLDTLFDNWYQRVTRLAETVHSGGVKNHD